MKNSKNISRAVFTALTVLLTAFIFGNSLADGDTSSGFSLLVTNWLNSILGSLNIPFELSHHFVRKLAHFSEYSLLGMLTTASVWAWRRRPWRFGCVWLPVVTGGCTAALDEWLQTFVAQRHGSPADVLLDFCGVLWASLAAALIIQLISRSRARKASQ